MGEKRATNESQKHVRRQKILAAAEALFQQTSFEDINMQAMADKVGLAKGTLYLYFKTKEELFLALYIQIITQWFNEMDGHLDTAAHTQPDFNITDFASLVSLTLLHYPILPRLIAITQYILERNIDETTALEFKRMLGVRLLKTGQLTEACLKFLEAGRGPHLFLQLYALVIGFQGLSEPAPVVKAVLQKPEMKMFQIEFTEEFNSALTNLLQGIECQNRRKNHVE